MNKKNRYSAEVVYHCSTRGQYKTYNGKTFYEADSDEDCHRLITRTNNAETDEDFDAASRIEEKCPDKVWYASGLEVELIKFTAPDGRDLTAEFRRHFPEE